MNLIQYGPVSKEAVKEIVGNAKKPVNVDLEVGGDIDEIADMEIGVSMTDDDYNTTYTGTCQLKTSVAETHDYGTDHYQNTITSGAAMNTYGYEMVHFSQAIAVSGADIDALMTGAADARKVALETEYEKNPALLYAAVRNILLRKGKQVEIVANYEPSLHYVSEWWKQLFGESEGKDQRGIFPAAVDLTTDLHSMGQFIQDGARIMFETVLNVEESPAEIVLQKEDVDTDGMNYLAGKTVDFVNKSAMNGTILAHTDGSVPNLMVKIPAQDAYSLGQLFYFFEFACGVSGYILGVNPFNQPGVESYKKNMFALLGKPGYEEAREALLKRL